MTRYELDFSPCNKCGAPVVCAAQHGEPESFQRLCTYCNDFSIQLRLAVGVEVIVNETVHGTSATPPTPIFEHDRVLLEPMTLDDFLYEALGYYPGVCA